MTTFDAYLSGILQAYSLPGKLIAIGAQTPRVFLKDHLGKVLIATGATVPTTGTAGYAKGCLFIKEDSPYASDGLYINIGTSGACLFRTPSYGSRWFYFENVAASGTNIHAAVAANDPNSFPGPFTNPDIPRSVECVFQAGWDGGDITVVGTDQFDNSQTEVIADVPGSTVNGLKIFKSITSASKETVGSTANTVTLRTSTKLGIPAKIVDSFGLLLCNGVQEAVTLDPTYHFFVPTSAPDGSRDYTLSVNVG